MTTTCPECDGYGEVRHPRWGARNCPDPTITCPVCHGTGGWAYFVDLEEAS